MLIQVGYYNRNQSSMIYITKELHLKYCLAEAAAYKNNKTGRKVLWGDGKNRLLYDSDVYIVEAPYQ